MAVSSLGLEPSEGTIYKSDLLSTTALNTILFPSGDQAQAPITLPLKGEFDRARELLLEQVAKLENHDPDRSRLLMTLNELGLIYSSLGQFSTGERIYRRALEVAEQFPEADREAQKAYEQALTIFEAAYGPDDDRTCRMVQNLGVLAARMNRGPEAAEDLARAVSSLEARLGSSHAELVKPLINQAWVHLRLNRPAAAQAFAFRALGIAETAYGPRHWLVGEALLVYGETLRANKRKVQAKAMQDRALAIQRENRADRAAGRATVHISDIAGKSRIGYQH